jgi:hypothetical protein
VIAMQTTKNPRDGGPKSFSDRHYTISDYLNRLEGVTKSGDEYKALCPAHNDKNPSLSIGPGNNGHPALHCFAGCSYDSIIAAMGLERPDHRQQSTKRKIVATYDYTDENGVLLRQKVRYEPKDFRIRCPDGNGDWAWKKGDGRPVLYQLPELLWAKAEGKTIFFPEGEKDVDTLVTKGLPASTNVEGASKDTQRQKWLKEYNRQLAGTQRLVLLPDADPQGRARVQHM